jgi:epidermal growth factor receptor substrate 15
MYLIRASMAGALPTIPQALPPYIYEQAKSGPDSVATHVTGSSTFSPSPTAVGFPRPGGSIQPQYTGTGIIQPQMTGQRAAPPLPARTSAISSFPLAPQATGQLQWDVTPREKAQFDQFYDTLDTQKRGFIEGDVAVPFMLQSKLSDDILAQIW